MQKKGKLPLMCNSYEKEFKLLISEGSYSPVLLKDQVSTFSYATLEFSV